MFQSILLDSTSGTLKEWFQNLWNDTGFVVDYSRFEGYSLGIWGCLIMLVVACFLVYLAVVKKFEPMLLVGIAFGAFLINIPGAYDALMAGPANGQPGGLFWYLYKGVEWVIFPPLIFLGIGAMTDFGPLIANPKSLLLGAAAQVGIFLALLIALHRVYSAGSGRNRHYRRRGRSYGNLRNVQARTQSYGTYCNCGVQLYGARSRHPASDYEAVDDGKGTKNPHGTTSSRVEKGKNNVPDYRYGYRRYRASQRIAASRNVDARKPVQGIRRCASPC